MPKEKGQRYLNALATLVRCLEFYLTLCDTVFLLPKAAHSAILLEARRLFSRLNLRIEESSYLEEIPLTLPFNSAIDFERKFIDNRNDSDYWWNNGLRDSITSKLNELEEQKYDLIHQLKATEPEIDFDAKLSNTSAEMADIRNLIFISSILDRLRGDQSSNEQSPAHFDLDRSTLELLGQKVRIRKMSDQFHLLRIIFADQTRIHDEWFFSEIGERYDESGVINEDKKFYNAAYQVSQKITKDAGIKDFFILTKQSLKINPKYLSQT